MNGAIDDGVIAVNPANHLSRGLGLGKSKEAEDVKAFTRDQVNCLRKAAADSLATDAWKVASRA